MSGLHPLECTTLENLHKMHLDQAPMALALSGGGDSMALALILKRLRKERKIGPFVTLTVDHGLRIESGQEITQVNKWMTEHGLIHILLNDESPRPETAIQEWARDYRYDLMIRHCKENKIPTLLTAHTMDDQAETVIMRLMRGAGIQGLQAIRCARTQAGVTIFRPLLDARRSDLRRYLDDHQQPWIEDPANQQRSFERVRIRQWLTEDSNPLKPEALAKVAGYMAEADQVLTELCADWAREHIRDDSFGGLSMEAEHLYSLPNPLYHRILALAMQRVRGRYLIQPQPEAVLSLRDKTDATLAGVRFRHKKGRLYLFREVGRIASKPARSGLWDDRFQIEIKTSDSELSDFTIAPLGRGAVRMIHPGWQGGEALYACPGLWKDKEILVAPSLDWRANDDAPGMVMRQVV